MALTFTEITKRMLKYRNPQQFVPGQIRTLKSIPYIGTKSIQHQALIKGQTNEYSVIVQFYSVEFVEDKRPGFIPVKVKLSTGDKLYYYKPPSLKKNPVALKCFTGDTLVCLTDGTSVPIKSLEGKEEFYIYSYDTDNKKVVIGKGHDCRKIETQSSLVKVTFDNESSVRCTPDHNFLMKDGTYKEAQKLSAGDSIEPLYRKLGDKRLANNKPFTIGYEEVHQGDDVWEGTHCLSDKYNLDNDVYDKSVGTIRHHKDFNKRNNAPVNVQRMKWYDHLKLHQVRMTGDTNPMKNPVIVEKVKRANRANGFYAAARQRANTPESIANRKKMAPRRKRMIAIRKRNGEYIGMGYRFRSKDLDVQEKISETRIQKIKSGEIDITKSLKAANSVNKKLFDNGDHYLQSEQHRQNMSIKNLRLSKEGNHPFQSLESKTKAGERAKIFLSTDGAQEKLFKGRAISVLKRNIKNMDGVFREAEFRPYRGLPGLEAIRAKLNLNDLLNEIHYNHKVTSVEFLNEKEDTYCFTVDKYHNFAIDIDNGEDCSSGVFVKNCNGPDFRFRFEYALSKVGSLIGPFRKYKKVPGSTRPPVNPDDIPGYDKHIRTLVNALLQAKMIVE